MNVLCPGCLKRVTVPDESAGKSTPCPNCNREFTPPELTPSTIDAAPTKTVAATTEEKKTSGSAPAAAPASKAPEPTKAPESPKPAETKAFEVKPPEPKPAPPAYIPPPRPATPPAPPPVPPVAAAPRPSAPERETARPEPLTGTPALSLSLSENWVRWLTPLGFLVAFLMTFFPWSGSYPNGTPVYTQTAWQSIWGKHKIADVTGEEIMKKEAGLKENSGFSLVMMLYYFGLLLAALISLGLVVTNFVSFTMPDAFKNIWEHRHLLMLALSIALPILLLKPLCFGFGIEAAAEAAAEKSVARVAPGEDGVTVKAADLHRREIGRDVEIASYALDRTTWLKVAVLAHLAALFGTIASVWLMGRENRGEPRVDLMI